MCTNDGGGNHIGVTYTAEKQELLDSKRSAHDRSLSGTCVGVSVIIIITRIHVGKARQGKATLFI